MKKTHARTTRPTINALRQAAGRAFTVVELLVAIGVVAIVTVGLAAIFDAVGKTVQGGKRASVLSQYATMVEDQLRKDISSIDPNSFIVIRQQLTDGGDGEIDLNVPDPSDSVALSPGALGGFRPRRIDEMVFFCRGDFASMRPPIASGSVARSHEARVYYGMGERMTPNYAVGTPEGDDFLTPTVGFRVLPTATTMPPLGKGVNKYASEWTLLRHVTVLQQPKLTVTDFPDLAPYGLPAITTGSPLAQQVADNEAQIALQPAAANIFRRLTRATPFPSELSAATHLWAPNDNEPSPSFDSGMVDVATTDLTEIRSIVVGVQDSPAKASSPVSVAGIFGSLGSNSTEFSELLRNRRTSPPPSPGNFDSLELMHLWMSEAFPTQSIPPRPSSSTGDGPIELGFFDTGIIPDPPGQRLRCEPQPVGMRDVVEQTPTSAALALRNVYDRASQSMLTAHNFVPRCSEFIVEWSFGRINPATNELIWHGPPRNGISGSQLGFYPFGDPAAAPGSPNALLEEGQVFGFITGDNRSPAFGRPDPETRFHPFTDRLIYGVSPSRSMATIPSVVTSYFGYIDPTFNPAKPIAFDPSAPFDDSLGRANTNSLMDWPRPRLIRVTMSLADARDPSKEETFQFVFDVPQDRAK